jgi:flagellar protein FlbB
MASFGRPRVLGRIVLLLAIIFALVIGGIVWFDYIGLIDAKTMLAPAYRLLGVNSRTPIPGGQNGLVGANSPALLEEERYAKRLESLTARSEELDAKEGSLTKLDAEVAQKAQQLDDRGKALDDKEKSFNDKVKQYDNRKANIDQNAQYLVGMPPAKAVSILVAMDDQTVIDTFHAVEERAKAAGESSLVSVWLAGMPAERSATLQRKMSAKPSSLE